MSFAIALFAASASAAVVPSASPSLSYDQDVVALSDMAVSRPLPIVIERAGGTARVRASRLDGDGAGGITFSPTIDLVSDYRFRGISLSNSGPALQSGIEAEANGFYAGVWASTIARFAGTKSELDIYGGWRGAVGGFDVDAGVVTYLYPRGDGTKYAELQASVGRTIGPVEVKAGGYYAPSQKHIGTDNLYLYADLRAGLPNTPLTFTAGIGYEDGSLAGPDGKKLDWSLGTEIAMEKFTIGLKYVDSDVKKADDPDENAQAALVASVGWAF